MQSNDMTARIEAESRSQTVDSVIPNHVWTARPDGFLDWFNGRKKIDPVLKADTPVYPYEPHSWGPKEAEALVPPGGWVEPIVDGDVTNAAG